MTCKVVFKTAYLSVIPVTRIAHTAMCINCGWVSGPFECADDGRAPIYLLLSVCAHFYDQQRALIESDGLDALSPEVVKLLQIEEDRRGRKVANEILEAAQKTMRAGYSRGGMVVGPSLAAKLRY